MPVSEESLTRVVNEASPRLSDPKYISGLVDRFIGGQPRIYQYIAAHASELTVEGVVTVLLHAALLAEAVRLATGRTAGRVEMTDLDVAARAAPTLEALSSAEPSLASYIASNFEPGGPATNRVAGTVLAHVARALVDAS